MNSLVYILCIFFCSQTNAARILAVFPTPSLSHQVIFQPLTLELARRGHDVTVITPNPVFFNDNATKLKEIDVHDISYAWILQSARFNGFGKKNSVFEQVTEVLPFNINVVTSQLKTDEIQNLINDSAEKFDLLLIEAWIRPALIYTHIVKAPVILVSSFGMMFGNEENVGAPTHPLLYPTPFQQRLYNLSFYEKFQMIYNNWWFKKEWFSTEREEILELRKVLGRDIPHYDELRENVDMLFLNSHPMWMGNQPLPPNVISIWGIHKKPEKTLPKDLQDYLDSSKHGVIYISFGTNAPSSYLPSEFIQLLVRVISKLPYDVLWKWETDELPGKSQNIRISKWLPQSDLLKHPKIKLFIMQGGLQSTDEALTAGVPLIGIPMIGDQWYNVEKFAYHRIGIKLDMETMTDNELQAAIETVIHDKSYRENIKLLRSVMNDQPESALERAVWWTEYVLRHGGAKHLRTRAANMPWTQYYEIELVLTVVIIVLTSLTLAVVVIYSVLKRVLNIALPRKIKSS